MLKVFAYAALFGFLAACGTGSATLTPGSTQAARDSGGSDITNTPPPSNPNGAPPKAATHAGTATFAGSIHAVSFQPTNAIFAMGPGANGTVELAVKISDQADDCALVTAQSHRGGAKSLWLRVHGLALGTPSVTLGDALRTDTQAFAEFYDLDSTCVETVPEANAASKSGTLDLQIGDPNTLVNGQFTVTLGSQGDKVAGTFAAAPCQGLQPLIANPNLVQTCD